MIGFLGRVLYGGLFVAAWPVALLLWAVALDGTGFVTWPVPTPRWAGWPLVGSGLWLVGSGMVGLVRHGEGLPMNAYPTRRLVTQAAYGWTAHPIYVGFTLAVLGTAILLGSPAGAWYAAPLSGLAAAALVLGYEGPATRARFGERPSPPRLGLPGNDETDIHLARRLWLCLAALGSWAILYSVFSTMPAPTGAIQLDLPVDRLWPHWASAVWVYSLAYPYAVIGPLLLATGREWRRYVTAAWLVTGLGFAIMLLLPGIHPFPDNPHSGLTGWLLTQNRALDAPWLAAPSFHVAWTALASRCLAWRWPRARLLFGTMTIAVAISCLLTGAHALVDVIGGYALARAGWHHRFIWARLVRASERLSNSMTSWRIGRLRILSHAVWSWLAAFLGVLTWVALAGPSTAPLALAIVLVGIASAGIWGLLLEGGGRLSRPFGYFGFLLGASACLLLLWVTQPELGSVMAAAIAVAAPLAQAVGRARCLVQGCCHGRPVKYGFGIRVLHPLSRVTQLAGLACTPIHPAPLYSAIANALTFAILLRLWCLAAPAGMIVGLYLIATGLARFVEERFRGEPQTPNLGGLNVYQWIAAALLPLGMLAAALPAGPVPVAAGPSLAGFLAALAAGTVAALAMSVDMPNSGLRLSELTVAPPAEPGSGRHIGSATEP